MAKHSNRDKKRRVSYGSGAGNSGATGGADQFRPGSHSSRRPSSRFTHGSNRSDFDSASRSAHARSQRAARSNASWSNDKTGSVGPADRADTTASHVAVSNYSRNASHYQARKASKKKIALGVCIALLVVLVGCGAAAAAWYANLSNTLSGGDNGAGKDITMTEAAVDGKPFYVLLLGGDSREDSKKDNRTDSIMVARVDEANKNVSIISVPRDLRVNIDGHGMCKINSAIEYGGYDTVIDEVNDLLGIKINYYAFIYFSGFKDLVDKLGGVTVAVPEGTYYNGTWVPAGDAVEINGTEALVLARCRHGYPADTGAYAMGDYQRTLNQRNLIKAIAKKILKQDVTQYPSLIEGLASCVETNMTADKIINMATNMKGFNTDKIEAAQLPICGDEIDGAWYAALYEDVFLVMRDNFVNGKKLTKGLDDFDTENNDNDLTSYCVDGADYAYCNYASIYGGTFTTSTSSTNGTFVGNSSASSSSSSSSSS